VGENEAKKQARQERQSDLDRIAREQQADKEKAAKDRPQR